MLSDKLQTLTKSPVAVVGEISQNLKCDYNEQQNFCSKKIGICMSDLKGTQKALKASCAPADQQEETPDLPQLSLSLSGSLNIVKY